MGLERLKQYLWSHRSRLHRRFMRTVMTLLFFLSIVTNVFHYLSYRDRQWIRERTDQMSAEAEARAKIQAMAIRARIERRDLTPAEYEAVQSLWPVSGYRHAMVELERSHNVPARMPEGF
jgi:hypothetical protein